MTADSSSPGTPPEPTRATAEICSRCGEPIRNLGYPDSYRPGCENAQCRLVAAIERALATGAKTVSNGLAPHYAALDELRAEFAPLAPSSAPRDVPAQEQDEGKTSKSEAALPSQLENRNSRGKV